MESSDKPTAIVVDVESQNDEIYGEKAMRSVIENTRTLVEEERQMTVMKAFRIYPKAMFWAIFFSLGVIMAGYDGQVIPSCYSLASFVNRYGAIIDGVPQVTAAWQSALSMGNPIGQVVGALMSSYPSERWGRKKVLMVSCIASIAFVFCQFFAPNLSVLCTGEVIAGLFWGVFVNLSPTYSSEVSPMALRGILLAFTNLAFVIGQFFGQAMAAGFQNHTDAWGYRSMFALQWLWPIVMLVGLPFAPESPWWLVRHGKFDKARKALKQLAWSDSDQDIENALIIIRETDRLEQELHRTSTYMDCFRGCNFRRSEIAIMAYSIQVLVGNNMIGYINYFGELAGLPESKALDMGVGNTAIGFAATCFSWILLSYFGRRTIYLYGQCLMIIMFMIIGILDCPSNYTSNPGYSWAQTSLLDVWTFIYQCTVGPLAFVIISEVSSSKLRSRSIAVSTAAQSMLNIVFTVAVPYMFNPLNGNMRGKSFFVFAGLSVLCSIWTFFRLPETRNRSFEELDIMFERRVRTWDFKNYDAFAYVE